MSSHHWTDEHKAAVKELLERGLSHSEIARRTGWRRETIRRLSHKLAEQGKLGTDPVLPGFSIKKITSQFINGVKSRESIQQGKAAGEVFEKPEGFIHKRISNLSDAEGRTLVRWDIVEPEKAAQAAALKAAQEAFLETLPRLEPIPRPQHCFSALLSQYTITDMHLGALAWNVETGSGDYDLTIGEKLLLNWFGAAIAASPNSGRAVFAQLGDFLHYDSFKAITPEHGHQLDADSRYPLLVRTAIRVLRQVVTMLLDKHEQVEVVMADANHDPTGGVWLREMFAALYEKESRLIVRDEPGTYVAVEHGDVSLFYHHGHRRNVANVDTVFAGKFRELYGRTRFSYAHTGHKHSDELKTTNLMKVEQHETLAAPDAYAANGGWLSGRSAKVIHYHSRRGEVSRTVITPEMVMDFAA